MTCDDCKTDLSPSNYDYCRKCLSDLCANCMVAEPSCVDGAEHQSENEYLRAKWDRLRMKEGA